MRGAAPGSGIDTVCFRGTISLERFGRGAGPEKNSLENHINPILKLFLLRTPTVKARP
jgi:hypothetical protein